MINTPGSNEINNKEKDRAELVNKYKLIQGMYSQLLIDTRLENLIHQDRFPSHFANLANQLIFAQETHLLAYKMLQVLEKYIDMLCEMRKDNKDTYMSLINQSVQLSSAYTDPTKSPEGDPRYGFKEFLEHVFQVAGYDLDNEENKKILEAMVAVRNK